MGTLVENASMHLMKCTLAKQDDVVQILPDERALEEIKVG